MAVGTSGMTAASLPLATLAAINMLRLGDNAVDAAVTACAIVCITEPHMAGIGGDCLALVGKPDASIMGLNGFGRSAKAATSDLLKQSGLTWSWDGTLDRIHHTLFVKCREAVSGQASRSPAVIASQSLKSAENAGPSQDARQPSRIGRLCRNRGHLDHTDCEQLCQS